MRRERQCRNRSKFGTYTDSEQEHSDSGVSSVVRRVVSESDISSTSLRTVLETAIDDMSDKEDAVAPALITREPSRVRSKGGAEAALHRSESRPSRRPECKTRERGGRDTSRLSSKSRRESARRPPREEAEEEEELSEEDVESVASYADGDDREDPVEANGAKLDLLIKAMTLQLEKKKTSADSEYVSKEIQSIASYRDTDEIHHYILSLEADLKDLEVPLKRWKRVLIRKLTPKARKTIRDFVSESTCTYDELKRALIKKLGPSRTTIMDKLFGISDRDLKRMDPAARVQYYRGYMDRLLLTNTSAEALALTIVTGMFRQSLYPSEKCLLEACSISSYEDLLDAAEVLTSGGRKSQDRYERREGGSDRSYSGSGRGENSRSFNTEGIRCFKCQGYGHRAYDCRRSGSSFTYTCFVCNEQGHKSIDCPNRADNVSKESGKTNDKPNAKKHNTKSQAGVTDEHTLFEFQGKCNGTDCYFLPDTGAVVSLVSEDLVGPSNYTGEYSNLVLADGQVIRRPMVTVEIELMGKQFTQTAAVNHDKKRQRFVFFASPPSSEGEALVTLRAMCLREERRHTLSPGEQTATHSVSPVSAVMTRAASNLAAQRVTEQETAENIVTVPEGAESESEPSENSSVGLQDVATPPEVVIEPKERVECEKTTVSNSSLRNSDEEWAGKEKEKGMVEDDVLVTLGCPDLVEESVNNNIKVEVNNDDSLKAIRDLAGRRQNGYFWSNGLLFHNIVDTLGDERCRLVVPRSRRRNVLRLAHEKGHIGAKKMREIINRNFSWPGLGKDIINWVNHCEVCARINKSGGRQATMVERPIVRVPFDSVAFDLVGPLPKAKGGVKYILTYACMATRWPEAVPLKNVTAEAVASGMTTIIFRTGLPSRILTDRGTVFVGKLCDKLCEVIGCDLIHTSPYRPQSNGVLERLHGTLKPMLAKAVEKGIDWADFLPMALFTLRQVTNRSTGFSPHELVFGRQMVGPLDLLYSGWVDKDYDDLDVCEWVCQLQDKLDLIHDMASAQEIETIEKRVESFDKNKVEREFDVGSEVLLRVPGLKAALSASWEGPYVISQKVSRVTYRIKKPESEHERIAHINNLKRYCAGEKLKLVAGISVVAEEDVEMEKWVERKILGSALCDGYCEEEIGNCLERHSECFSNKPGLCVRGVCKIVLEEGANVVNIPPRNIPVRIKEDVEAEIRILLDDGIIVPSDSEWCSPIVPVRKKDGSVRLCVDFRELNKVTPLRRFWLPSLREILDEVGPSAVLSKLDLTSGFHQVIMDKDSSELTTFGCSLGKFKFVRMPFGLKNAPAVFQAVVEEVLKPVKEISRNYIDDVVVFSKDWKRHLVDLGKVLDVLRKAGLKVKRSKCEFGRRTMEYLGHQIGDGKLGIPEARVCALRDYDKPVTKKQMRACLGTFSYYREFIPGFASHSALLTPSTALAAPHKVVWTVEMETAFGKLRTLLSNAVVLFVPLRDDDLVIYTDASGGGIGGCLHVIRGDKELPAAFYSRQLRGAESRYSVTELESLAILVSLRHFDHYVYGAKVKIVTDHRACLALNTSNHLNKRLMRMALKIQQYDVEIEYRPGKLNGNADGLSRQNYVEEEDDASPGPGGFQLVPTAQGLPGGPVVPGRRHDENGKEKKKEREESRKKRKNKEH